MAEEKDILLKVKVDRTDSEKELQDVTKNLLENKQAVDSLNKSYKAGEVSTEAYVKETITLKQTQKQLTDQQKTLNKEIQAETGSVNDLRNKLAALTKERNNTNLTTKEGAERAKELNKEILSLSESIKSQEEAGGNFTRNVGNYKSAFEEAGSGVQVFGTSLSGLFKMILTNPIGLILLALTSLFKILNQNEQIATFFKGVMTGLGFAMDKVSGAISEVVLGLGKFGGENSKLVAILKDVGTRILNNLLAPLNYVIDLMPAVSAALEGEFAKSAEIAGEATKQFGKNLVFMNDEVPKFVEELSAAVKVGIAYESALNDIEDAQSELNVTNAKAVNERDKLLLQSKDLSRSEEERIALSEKASKIDEQILARRVAIINRSIKAEQDHLAQISATGNEADEVRHKLNDLQVEQLNAANESLKFQEKNQNRRNAIIEKQLADEAKLADAKKKALEDQAKAEDEFTRHNENSINKLTQFKLDQNAKVQTDLEKKLEAELTAESFRVEVLLSNEKLLASEKEFILADSAARVEQLTKTSEEKIRAEQDKTAKNEKQLQEQKVGLASEAASTLAGLAKQGSDEQKALSITAALINTYQGATKALASYPPPLSFAAAALQVAAGLGNVAKISKAAGGGDFVTTKPTLLLVGDNPGARERVTVTPLSGRGKTSVHPGSGMIAMAGGGSITTGATLTRGLSSPISDEANQVKSLQDAILLMPAPVVSVKEVTNKSNRVKVKEGIKNL
jgi:hypothetical protein